PNVGKTTLLFKLTGAKAEINSYPFTTKSINLGYFSNGEEKIQVIDTPGTLNRFDRMNSIEQQAHLALKYLADTIVYVFDLTGEYPMEQQLKLYDSIKKFNKKVIIYFSKEDVVGKEKIKGFAADNKINERIITDAEEIMKEI
ncbi:50S ribosome-binding GTPase, partial [Candidatus Woesearchaeota archaeon]|nr:50S ribosome-binding GTPase [Candidatus Woesearchaeota archaeon]